MLSFARIARKSLEISQKGSAVLTHCLEIITLTQVNTLGYVYKCLEAVIPRIHLFLLILMVFLYTQ